MLLQVPPDAGAVVQYRDALVLEVRGRADPGEHQQMRRIIGAAGEDHFAGGADDPRALAEIDLHPDAALAFEHQPVDQRARADFEVLACP